MAPFCGVNGEYNEELDACICRGPWENAFEYSFEWNRNGSFAREIQPCTFNEAYLSVLYIIISVIAVPETLIYIGLLRRWSQVRRNGLLISGYILYTSSVLFRAFHVHEGFGHSRRFVIIWAIGFSLCNSGSLLFVSKYVIYRNKLLHENKEQSHTKKELISNYVLTILSKRWFSAIMIFILTLMAVCFIAANELMLSDPDTNRLTTAKRLVYTGLGCNVICATYHLVGPLCFLHSFINDLKGMVKGNNAPKDKSVLAAVTRIRILWKLGSIFLSMNLGFSLVVFLFHGFISLWPFYSVYYMMFNFLIGSIIIFVYSSNRRKMKQSSTPLSVVKPKHSTGTSLQPHPEL